MGSNLTADKGLKCDKSPNGLAERGLASKKMKIVKGIGMYEHGGFQRPEELMNVKGIREKSYAKLKPYLNVGDAPRPNAATAKK